MLSGRDVMSGAWDFGMRPLVPRPTSMGPGTYTAWAIGSTPSTCFLMRSLGSGRSRAEGGVISPGQIPRCWVSDELLSGCVSTCHHSL